MLKKVIILDFENSKVILSKTEDSEDIEEYITEELGLKLSSVEYMIVDEVSLEW